MTNVSTSGVRKNSDKNKYFTYNHTYTCMHMYMHIYIYTIIIISNKYCIFVLLMFFFLTNYSKNKFWQYTLKRSSKSEHFELYWILESSCFKDQCLFQNSSTLNFKGNEMFHLWEVIIIKDLKSWTKSFIGQRECPLVFLSLPPCECVQCTMRHLHKKIPLYIILSLAYFA